MLRHKANRKSYMDALGGFEQWDGPGTVRPVVHTLDDRGTFRAYSCPRCGAVLFNGDPVCYGCNSEIIWSEEE